LVRCEIDAYPVQVRHARRPDPRPVEQRAAGAVVGLLRELADAHRPVADGSVSGGATSDRARADEAGRREPGSILVFLPGVGEIQRCDDLLRRELAADPGVPVLPLHGSLALDRQEAALRGGHRVVLATNVAESSVTVEGVVAVVDGGMERILRFDPASGLDRIELTAVSRASADQRAGRAGRTGPGICVRVWTESEQAARVAERQPEIQRVDLAGPTLVVRAWGDDPATLRWPDPPSAAQLAHAGQLLAELGALADDTVTARGRRMAKLPLHPRLSSLVLFRGRARVPAGGCPARRAARRAGCVPATRGGRGRRAHRRAL
jgi:ATP-dependent helicase HrpB